MRLSPSLAFAAAMAAATFPAAADNLVINLTPEKSAPARERTFVEAHDILLLDVSGSMDDAEIIAMFDGAGAYYTSDEAVLNYDSGICTAVTAVFYGAKAFSKPTHTLCNREDAQRFVAENVDLVHIAAMRTEAGTSATYLRNGLNAAIEIFGRGDVETTRRRVVVVGDEKGGEPSVLLPPAMELPAGFGATVSAVAIGSGGSIVQTAFSQSVVTPPGAKYVDVQYDGTPYEVHVLPGRAYTAKDPAELSWQLQQALSLGAG